MTRYRSNLGRRKFLKVGIMVLASPLLMKASGLASLAAARTASAASSAHAAYNRAIDKMVEAFRKGAKAVVGWNKRSSMFASPLVTKESLIRTASASVTYNPFWINESYATNTRWGGLIAFPMYEAGANNFTTDDFKTDECGFERQLWPGEDYEFLRPIRIGDRLRVWNREPKLIELEHPDHKGVRGVVNLEADCDIINQRGEIVSTYKNQTVRYFFPEGAPGTNFKLSRYGFTEAEILYLDRMARSEEVRGAEIRYWEDVKVGDMTKPVVIGPTNIADIYAQQGGGMPPGAGPGELQAAAAGGPGGPGGPMGGAREPQPLNKLLKNEGDVEGSYLKADGFYYKSAGRHADDLAAQAEGEPGAFLWGRMSVQSMLCCLTNWIGDDAFVRKFSWRHVYRTIIGDSSYALGKVTKKYQDNGEYLVDLALWQQDMRGFIVDAAVATVALLSKTQPYPEISRDVDY